MTELNRLNKELSSRAESVFSLTIDLSLVNHLRSFKKHNGLHEFEPYFIESIYGYLYYYQGNMEAEIFDEFC